MGIPKLVPVVGVPTLCALCACPNVAICACPKADIPDTGMGVPDDGWVVWVSPMLMSGSSSHGCPRNSEWVSPTFDQARAKLRCGCPNLVPRGCPNLVPPFPGVGVPKLPPPPETPPLGVPKLVAGDA